MDNATFTSTFEKYQKAVDDFVKAFVSQDWAKSKQIAEQIEAQSKNLKNMGEKDDTNKIWGFDAVNLWHHSQELNEAIAQKEGVEVVYLVGTLIAHLGYIQGANPQWLREYLRQQIDTVEKGLQTKNLDETRDAAEAIHLSASKIAFSAGFQKDLYFHTRWLEDVRQLSPLGDDIIAKVRSSDWEGPKTDLREIKDIYNKWDKSFKG